MTDLYSRKNSVVAVVLYLSLVCNSFGQVDTTYIYNTSTPYGTLDIRLAKSSTRYYYLQENKTFSFRESSPGVKTGTYRDMTSWDSSPYTQGNLREKNGRYDYYILNYRMLFPVGYKATATGGYPLIVMMHGAGERGNCWDNSCYHDDRSYNPNQNDPPAPTSSSSNLLNNDHNLLHGGKPHLDARNLAGSKLPNDPTLSERAFPGFVLFPQNLNGWYGSSNVQDAIRLIRLIVKKYNINPDQIYIHGLSNGGIAVYETIKRAPWLFAAALPMSSPGDGGILSKNLQSTVAHIPFWMFQGGQDGNPTPSKTEGYIKKFRDAGAIVRYSLYENLGHGVWNTAYKEPDFFSWMLKQSKAKIHLFAGASAICISNGQGVRMELAAGFRAYQWERDGAIISGATSSKYVATTKGTYRARFSRKPNPSSTDWNKWSDPVEVTEQNPASPVVDQTGTALLKDLNNYNYAHLNAKASADYYYWYKDGVLQNLYGTQDDTTRYPRFSAGNCTSGCTGNGAYTLVTKTADGCQSKASAPVQVYFNNQAPINITAPTNFNGAPASLATVKLNWTDASSNEKHFEIWRRKVLGSSSFTKWEMRGLTNANVQTLTDVADPSSTYQYKIRAVGSSGRSNYTPSASNAFLTISTTDDTSAPSAPQSLTASTSGISSIKLSWKASTDNSGIKQYRIYFDSKSIATGSDGTSYNVTDLQLNKQYNFTVKAEDLGGNLSASSNTASADTYVEGLYYEHSTGAWQDLDEINWAKVPEFTGHVDNITLGPRTQEDYFNFKFNGYLYISSGGSYQFRTTSDDGSRVELDNVIVVNNDGVHGNKTVTGSTISLSSGAKQILVKYFENSGGQSLTVQYKGPDTNNSWLTIPDGALTSRAPSTMTLASNDEADLLTTEVETPLSVRVFPNPANQGNIHVQLETLSEAPVELKMIDFQGNVVYHGVHDAREVNNILQLQPLHQLRQGFYLLFINQDGKSLQERISIRD